jgi:type II restriction/modification system DNA methylase subunit YeeA
LGESDGYIDMLWKGTILIEMKSRGKNLDRAYQQAKDYIPGLKEIELPKYILISDFENFRLYDLEESTETDFKLEDFVNHVQQFGFIAGYQKRTYKAEDPVNIEAAYLMGKLHDALKEAGYSGHELEKYLVRLLFCLFAEDTTIFEKRLFQEYIETKTNEDGTDLGMHIAQLFQVLNTPTDKRQKTLDESLNAFPYVNGQLFEEQLSFASFNTKMRQTLLECCALDWSKISPAIFGSMFQSVMDANQRRNLGAHYTSEKNILKLIKPLFLDKLWQEFESIKTNTNKLKAFQRKIASLRFLDPACGCGNFLVITYRELRLLELAILKELQKGQRVINLEALMQCNVDRFYGIEYEEFPAQIAQVALWLIDHQMNMQISQEFGEYFVRLPL